MAVLKVFISYARADGEPLAARLERDLAAAGFDVWRDKQEITAGESWATQIETALDTCNVLLAVLSAGASRSAICRGEQLRALRKGARILPLLAQADADRPVYLEAAHWLDFSQEEAYPQRLNELLIGLNGADGLHKEQLSAVQLQQVEAEDPALPAPARDWVGFAVALNAFSQPWWDGLSARRPVAGIYEPTLHVERKDARQELDRWRQGPHPRLLLVGAAGVGKTHLLAHWLDERRREGDAVWAVSGDRTSAPMLPQQLAQALGDPTVRSLPTALQRVGVLAREHGRDVCLWLVVDGVNDTPGSLNEVRALLEAAEALPVPGGGAVRVLLSCSLVAWRTLNDAEPMRLDWGQYHQPEGAEVLTLERFSESESEQAFENHARHFQLSFAWQDLPSASRRRLRDPLLMRLMAEALRGRSDLPPAQQFDTLVFQLYWERTIRGGAKERLVEALAQALLQCRRESVPLAQFHEAIGPDGTTQAQGDDYRALLDDGVFSEAGTRSIFEDTTELRFTHQRIASYAVVRLLLKRRSPGAAAAPDVQALVRELAAAVDELPLLWESALTLLVLKAQPQHLAELSGDADTCLRELAVQALVRRFAVAQAPTHQTLMGMVESGNGLRQRSAIRAAYHVGPAARLVLEHCALSNKDALRLAVRDTLYFIWSSAPSDSNAVRGELDEGAASAATTTSQHVLRYLSWRHSPDFTERLIDELCSRVSLRHPLESRRIVKFVSDLMLTIFVNHCDRPEVVDLAARTMQAIARGFGLTRLSRVGWSPMAKTLASHALVSVLGEPVRDWLMLVNGPQEVEFFDLPTAERLPMAEAADWIDPATDIARAEPLLQTLLGHPQLPVLRSIGAFLVGVHSLANPDRAEPVVRRLFDALPGTGRAWMLASMSLLVQRTPASWLPLLSTLTERQLNEDRQASGPPVLVPFFDGLFVPLALAAAKAGEAVPLFDRMLAQAAAAHGRSHRLLQRLLAALGIVGFYQPQAVLRWLAPHLPSLLTVDELQTSLVECLATVRTLHDEAVDLLLADAGAADTVLQDLQVATEPARVQPFMRFVGFYNNVVYQCVHYPRMRVELSQFALHQLTHAPSSKAFSLAYASQALDLALSTGFDLHVWLAKDTATPTGTQPATVEEDTTA